jgi:hypothetical protein
VKKPATLARNPDWIVKKQPRSRKASDGSRTHNPRITNAVLCQLKLRWRDALEFIISVKRRQYLAVFRWYPSNSPAAPEPVPAAERSRRLQLTGAVD